MTTLLRAAAELGPYGASVGVALYGLTLSVVAGTAVFARRAARRRAALHVLRVMTRTTFDRQ